ncbi:MAG: hypothetical protein J5906_11760 [Acidaminococcaceae bacterium]|nr:hypothetical protein [Acidaminococcaceae bacterium]
MIYFKTLNNNLVQYKNKFRIRFVREYINPEIIHEYFTSAAEVALFVYIGKSPVWAVASYAEKLDTIMPKNFYKLPLKKRIEIFEEFDDMNEAELATLKLFATNIVIPFLTSCCKKCAKNKDYIIDVRHAFDSDCQRMGFLTIKK